MVVNSPGCRMIPLFVALCFVAVGTAIECPGGKRECPEEATCCELPDGTYGCCPLPNAVCCDDHIHCCPAGTRCGAGMCFQTQQYSAALKSVQKIPKNVCPGGEFSCPDQSTCCMDEGGKAFGCCLLPDGVCCSDGQHCCPKDTACDLQNGTCRGNRIKYGEKHLHIKDSKIQKNGKPFLLKKMKDDSSVRGSAITCPGGAYTCPDGYTCCQLPDQSWGCCPFANATCCSDHLHCCPSGLKCDSVSKTCEQGVKASKKIPAKPVSDLF